MDKLVDMLKEMECKRPKKLVAKGLDIKDIRHVINF